MTRRNESIRGSIRGTRGRWPIAFGWSVRRLMIGMMAAALTTAAAAAEWTLTGVLGAHDPTLIKDGTMWWCFTTGAGLPVKYSSDGRSWSQGVRLFETELSWWRTYAPNMGQLDVWAPDLQKFGGRIWCYYAVSEFGKNNSAIGLKSCTSIGAGDWRDDGLVIASKSGIDDYNAIDPNLTVDASGNPWLAFGSWFDGIHVVQLDPATMKPTGEIHAIARRGNGVEGANIVYANGFYYLFVSIDKCCQGVDSTYKIAYGRSTAITGPYVDKDNVRMADGGGTVLEAGGERWKGPGGQDVYQNGNDWIMARHAYDAQNAGRPTLEIADLYWDSNHWPTLTPPPLPPPPATPAQVGAYASGPAEVTLTWQPPAAGGAATGYRLERAADKAFTSGLTAFDLGAATSYVDTSAAAGTAYFYRLSATNAGGSSAPSATLSVQTPSGSGSGTTSFVNIATRAFCGPGNKVTIGGFVISGGASKRILVRAVGPTLVTADLGVEEVLADPVIELHDAQRDNVVIATNDNWSDNANASEIVSTGARIGATPFANDPKKVVDHQSAALLLTMLPGIYSFVASGRGGASGIVLIEVYDAD
jgi:arabinan endo-1,5-alpha-L-arabinosidase